MKKIIISLAVVFSSCSFARIPDVMPDQNITINVKYDKDEKKFFDFSATGSQFIDFQLRDDGFVITHGRDGFLGLCTEFNQQGIAAMVTNKGANQIQLASTSTGSTIPVQVGLVSSSIKMLTGPGFFGQPSNNNCNWQDFPGWDVGDIKFYLNNPFESSWCTTTSFFSHDYCFGNNVNNIGLIERFFRFDMRALDESEFGVYESTFSDNSSYIRLDYFDHPTVNVMEMYRFRIRVEMMPSINSFSVDNENLAFLVTRQKDKITGKAQTGFNIRGSFYNSQSFNLSFTSLNNARCEGALCMFNSETGKVIPYKVGVLDPVTLQNKLVTRNDQSITIDADKKFQLHSGLLFEFEDFDTALSGTFNDTVTLRAEMSLE